MLFIGISKTFSLKNEDQYNTIGQFWDELTLVYGLENLVGLGYKWDNEVIYYAIGLKDGVIKESNFQIELPNVGWEIVEGRTDELKFIYDKIYLKSSLKYEIETFTEDGKCRIEFIREEMK